MSGTDSARRLLAGTIASALVGGALALAGPARLEWGGVPPAERSPFFTPIGARVASTTAGSSLPVPLLPVEPGIEGPLRVGIAKAAFTPASGASETALVAGEFYQAGRIPWAEPFEDQNGDGVYNFPNAEGGNGGDPEPWTDLNLNGKWDGQWVSGFGSGTARGVHDDVWARAVVLESGSTRVALVSVDAVGLFYEEVEKISAALPPSLGVDLVSVSSTHTHESSDTLGLWGPLGVDGKDPHTMAALRDAAVRAITLAAGNLQFATVGGGVAPADNLQSDGRYPYVIDRDVYALRFDRADGSGTIGTLVNWSSHPESLWSHNLYISSDFPHWTRQKLEATYGGTSVYFSGSVGGIIGPGSGSNPGSAPNAVIVPDAGGNPIVIPPWPEGENQAALEGQALRPAYRDYFTKLYARAQGMGEIVADAARSAIDAAATPIPVDFIRWKSQRLFVPIDNAFLFAYNAAGAFDRDLYIAGQRTSFEPPNACPPGAPLCVQEEYSEFAQLGAEILTREDYIELGSIELQPGGPPLEQTRIEIVTVPGELSPEIANGYGVYASFLNPSTDPDTDFFHANQPEVPSEPVIRDAMQAPVLKILLGLGNDELGYIIPANDFVAPTLWPVYGRGVDQYDNRGGRSHYEETVSAGSKLAPTVARELVALIRGTSAAYWQGAHGGFLDASGRPQEAPDADTRGIWLNTSDTYGADTTKPNQRYTGGVYNRREDTTIFVGSTYGGGLVGGFVDAQGRKQASPGSKTRGVWIDGNGDGLYTPGVDGVIMVDTYLLSDNT